jgi:hypothetical protein
MSRTAPSAFDTYTPCHIVVVALDVASGKTLLALDVPSGRTRAPWVFPAAKAALPHLISTRRETSEVLASRGYRVAQRGQHGVGEHQRRLTRRLGAQHAVRVGRVLRSTKRDAVVSAGAPRAGWAHPEGNKERCSGVDNRGTDRLKPQGGLRWSLRGATIAFSKAPMWQQIEMMAKRGKQKRRG